MRVLHLAAGDAWGGAEQSITLLASAQQEHCDLEVSACVLNEGRLADGLRKIGVSVEILPEDNRSLRELRRDLARYLKREKFDIVHSHRYKETLSTVRSRALGATRLVVTLHGMEPWRQQGFTRALTLWSVLWLARLRGGSFVGVSSELARRLRANLRTSRVARIPNIFQPRESSGPHALDLRVSWPESAHRPLIGFVGRLEGVKAPDRVLEIAARRNVDAAFAIIGSGSMAAELEKRIEDQRLQDRVRLFGEVADAQLLLGQLDALILPSRHEGLPMVLLEAAAAGLPVTGFDVGGTRDILDGSLGAQLVEPANLRAFERALSTQLEGLERARSEARAWSAKVADRYAPRTVAQDLLEFYRATL